MGDDWNEPRDKGPTEKIESLAEDGLLLRGTRVRGRRSPWMTRMPSAP